jgi:hypothetical protein
VHDFTPVSGAVGGALIALSLAVMLIATGRIAGLSGVVAGLVRPAAAGDRVWRAWFAAGMLAAGGVFELAAPATFDGESPMPLPVVVLSGVLVGFGTRLANGCTSGHGLCGVSRLARRSILATMTFFAIGVATATITGALCGH